MTEYKNPALTVDTVIIDDNDMVLIQRLNNPYKDYWALPGGFVNYGECVEDAAVREAKEETNLDVELIKLVGVYSNPDRDPRGHTVSVVYLAKIIGGYLKSDSDAKNVKKISIDEISEKKLAFDHNIIIQDALKEHDL